MRSSCRTPARLALIAIFTTGCTHPQQSATRAFALELEGGAIWSSRNEVAVPGDTGTRFDLDQLTGSGPVAGGRVYLGWRPAGRHELRALYAPFEVEDEGSLDQPVVFEGRNFAAGVPTRGTYRFDSYRLTYRYRFAEAPTYDASVGFTAKIRDAEIGLQQGAIQRTKTDTGFVPLLHLAGNWHFAELWRLNLDLDGSWAPQGRALDLSLKTYWRFADGYQLGFGYRTVEGGADNDEVYTFAWIHEAVVSLMVEF